MLAHFDTKAIFAPDASRPMRMHSGDEDGGAPTDGIEVLEEKVGANDRPHGRPDHFRSVVYE